MKSRKNHIVTNLQKINKTILFSFFLFITFFAACSTPTISSDDSDENNFSRRAKQDENLSSAKDGEFSSSSSKVSEPIGGLSSSLDDPDGWNWDVPKELRLNPEIDYDSIIDARDGKVYKTVKIGDQVWMAENLNFDPGQGGSGEDKYDWSWCYDNDPQKCDVAGRLYTWAAAIDSVALATDKDNPMNCGYGRACELPSMVRGICPSGWHLPSSIELEILKHEVGWEHAAKVLKSQTGWGKGGNGTDAVGFSALPAGYRDNDSCFYLGGDEAYFWGAAEYSGGDACDMNLYNDDDTAYLYCEHKYHGFSVRCLKD